MAHDPHNTPDGSTVPSDDEKPDDLSEEEWAAIQEARAELAAGHYYTQEQIETWVRERQAARRRSTG